MRKSKNNSFKISEKEIQKTILEYLQWNNIFSWRNNSGYIFTKYKGKTQMIKMGAVGSPDIIGIYKGKFLGIEVKSATGTLRPEQKEFLDKINAEGGFAFVARNLDDVIKNLKLKEL